jgi:hypothetical protein
MLEAPESFPLWVDLNDKKGAIRFAMLQLTICLISHRISHENLP